MPRVYRGVVSGANAVKDAAAKHVPQRRHASCDARPDVTLPGDLAPDHVTAVSLRSVDVRRKLSRAGLDTGDCSVSKDDSQMLIHSVGRVRAARRATTAAIEPYIPVVQVITVISVEGASLAMHCMGAHSGVRCAFRR
jgi:hypothetical protein